MRFLKPLDESILDEVGRRFRHVVVVENGVKTGGLGSAVLEWMNDHGYRPTVVRLGLPDDKFVEHGSVEELQRIVGLDDEAIARVIAKYQQ
jgi:1-deoxy-D-xylulose-5-phosphate synthase